MAAFEERPAVNDNDAEMFRFLALLGAAACGGLYCTGDDCGLCECKDHITVLDPVGRGVGDDMVCDDEALADKGIDGIAKGLLGCSFRDRGVNVGDEVLKPAD